MSLAITALYVPGNRPDRFSKAVASGADVVIFDLEDAVPASDKSMALSAVLDFLTSDSSAVRRQVRVNSGASSEIAALAHLEHIEFRIPKVESIDEVDAAIRAASGARIVALIETALGIEHIGAIASGGIAELALGESDLASDLGSSDPRVMDWVRVRALVAARAAGLPAPMLSAYPGIRDLDGLAADTARGAALGFVGRTAVHPSQLTVIRAAFRPPAEEVDHARAVLAALDEAGGGVVSLADGEMVDAAMAGRARAVLERLAATS